MNSQPPDPDSRGRDHADLEGGHDSFRYRPPRLQTDHLSFKPVCRFRVNGSHQVAREVFDISPSGLAISAQDPQRLQAGTVIDHLQVTHCNQGVWSGKAVVVYASQQDGRIGIRIERGSIEVGKISLRDELVESRLNSELYGVIENEKLPSEWRAGIAQTRILLHTAQELMGRVEEAQGSAGWRRDAQRKRDLAEMVYEKWWPFYRDQLTKMDSLSKQLPASQIEAAQDYASKQLMPYLEACPMHHRAFHKPLGYAGDYRLMLLGNDAELSGDSLYGCLLQHTVQNYGLGRAIVERCATAGHAVAAALRADRPTRIVSLASGPAIELRQFLETHPVLQQPVELILVDQDHEAIEHAYQSLSHAILSREDGHLIKLTCLHFSISQLLTPVNEDERHLIADTLSGVDLIYSMGLFDYLESPVAARLLRKLFGLLADEGRLFIGNLQRVRDCSWAMDYAVHWELHYRDEAAMLELARKARVENSRTDVMHDATGHCLFLDLRR